MDRDRFSVRGQGSPTLRARVEHASGQVRHSERASLWARHGGHVEGVGRQVHRRDEPDRTSTPNASGQDRRYGGVSVLIMDDLCMAWLLEALSQAPALTEEQLRRARRRLAQS